MTIENHAEKEARAIFYKIESLVFDAVRVELKTEIDAIIDHYLSEERKLAQERAMQPRNENMTKSAATKKTTEDDLASKEGDDYAAIRQIIDEYVKQSLEEQAPAIIVQTLTQALGSGPLTSKKPS